MGWKPTGGGASPNTTKGDLHGFSTVDARIPVGTNGQVLTADSTQTLGLKWAAAGAGGSTVPVWMERLAARSGSPHSDDDEFDDDSITGWTGVTPAGTITWVEKDGLLSALFEDQAANDICCQLKAMTPSVSPVTIETVGRVASPAAAVGTPMYGLVFTDGTVATSSAVAILAFHSANNGLLGFHLYSGTLTALTTVVKNYTTISAINTAVRIYLRLIWAAANSWKVQWSPNGVQWTDYNQGAQAANLTPTHYGVFASSWSYTQESIADFEYFRVTESDLYE